MRYEKLEYLLDLALDMQLSRRGVSIKDIENKFSVSRRTAVRMKDLILNVFLDIEETIDDSRIKRWKIHETQFSKLLPFNNDDISDLTLAAKTLKNNNLEKQAESMFGLIKKLKSTLRKQFLLKLETDLEVLDENEDFIFKSGPKPIYQKDILNKIRFCIKSCKKVNIKYQNNKNELKSYILEPYGVLYGHRHYLVVKDTKDKKIKYFSLPKIKSIEVTCSYFERDEYFSLKKFRQKSFGIFEEKPFYVEIKFDYSIQNLVDEFQFHENQLKIINPDGTTTIKFQAGGLIEMVWYFFMWGEKIEIIKPKKLKKLIDKFKFNWKILP